MRYPASEKLEIIRTVEQSHLSAKRTLDQLGIPRRTFYRWYDRYLEGGPEALEDRPSAPSRVWNRIPAGIHDQIIELALEQSELSPRELAVRFTDGQRYFVSESTVLLFQSMRGIVEPAPTGLWFGRRSHQAGSHTVSVLPFSPRLGGAQPSVARSREVLRWRTARRPDDLARMCERLPGKFRICNYFSHAAGEQVRPRSPCLQRSLLAFSSDIGILKSGRGSKDFERTLGDPRTTQVGGCRSHAQKAST